jgi:sec-independent protein translocase protein TatA
VSFGFWEILILLLIVLVLFGAGKLPRLMGDVAQGIKAFKKGMKEAAAEDEPPATTAGAPLEPPKPQGKAAESAAAPDRVA